MPEDHPGSQAPKVYPQARKQPRRPTTELPSYKNKKLKVHEPEKQAVWSAHSGR